MENHSQSELNEQNLGMECEIKTPKDIKMGRFPDNLEIWKWWETQNFQKENGEQEYTMIYEIDLPKILKAFYEYFGNQT